MTGLLDRLAARATGQLPAPKPVLAPFFRPGLIEERADWPALPARSQGAIAVDQDVTGGREPAPLRPRGSLTEVNTKADPVGTANSARLPVVPDPPAAQAQAWPSEVHERVSRRLVTEGPERAEPPTYSKVNGPDRASRRPSEPVESAAGPRPNDARMRSTAKTPSIETAIAPAVPRSPALEPARQDLDRPPNPHTPPTAATPVLPAVPAVPAVPVVTPASGVHNVRAEQEPIVQISIGRVEIRALLAPPSSPPVGTVEEPAATGGVLSLTEYLRGTGRTP